MTRGLFASRFWRACTTVLLPALGVFHTAGCCKEKPTATGAPSATPPPVSSAEMIGEVPPRSVAVPKVSSPVFAIRAKLVSKEIGFGGSLALRGNRALVATSNRVLVLERNASGTWAQAGVLNADDEKDWDLFGSELALESDVAVANAPHRSNACGAVYTFSQDAGVWRQTAQFLPSSVGEPCDKSRFFGGAPTVEGDAMLVGSYDGAYAFTRRSDGTWQFDHKLVPPEVSKDSRFGTAIAMSGGHAFVSDPWAHDNEGRVYVFDTNPAGKWTYKQTLRGEATNLFGQDLRVQGDSAFVVSDVATASARSVATGPLGSVFVFRRNPDGEWVQEQRIRPPDGKLRYFGSDVGMAGSTLVIGGWGQVEHKGNVDKALDPGGIYFYRKGGSGKWEFAAELSGGDVGEDDFARAMAISGNQVFVAARVGSPSVEALMDAGPGEAKKLLDGEESAVYVLEMLAK